MLTFCDRLLIGFFLSNLDVTIVSSSLTSMTDDLKGFEKRSWIVTGYLATYTGMTPKFTFEFVTMQFGVSFDTFNSIWFPAIC
jgi:MFS family permease